MSISVMVTIIKNIDVKIPLNKNQKKDEVENSMNFLKRVDWLNVPTGTYVRYLLAILAAVNVILNAFGLKAIILDDSKVYDVVSAVIFILILFVNTYKDNPTSPEAIESNKFMKRLKAENKIKENEHP